MKNDIIYHSRLHRLITEGSITLSIQQCLAFAVNFNELNYKKFSTQVLDKPDSYMRALARPQLGHAKEKEFDEETAKKISALFCITPYANPAFWTQPVVTLTTSKSLPIMDLSKIPENVKQAASSKTPFKQHRWQMPDLSVPAEDVARTPIGMIERAVDQAPPLTVSQSIEDALDDLKPFSTPTKKTESVKKIPDKMKSTKATVKEPFESVELEMDKLNYSPAEKKATISVEDALDDPRRVLDIDDTNTLHYEGRTSEAKNRYIP